MTGDFLRHTWDDHAGVHVSDRGDSCLVAFGDARSAVKACADAQRRLAAEPWPPGGRTGVRMGVHTGLATLRNGDYIALAVHRTARVMSAAHGGQVLASETAVTDIGPRRDVGLGSAGDRRAPTAQRYAAAREEIMRVLHWAEAPEPASRAHDRVG